MARLYLRTQNTDIDGNDARSNACRKTGTLIKAIYFVNTWGLSDLTTIQSLRSEMNREYRICRILGFLGIYSSTEY